MQQAESGGAKGVRVECVVPILCVRDLRASLGYYEGVLGFGRDWGGDGATPGMASVSRDGRAIMLCEGEQGRAGTWVWVGVEDARALHAEFAARGAKVVLGLTNFAWALEFRVEDPDGHVLRFGSEPEAGVPIVE